MNKKIQGYIFLLLALILLTIVVKDFFFFTPGIPSFVEKTFGIYEPFGSLISLFIATVCIGFSLFYIWNIRIKKIIAVIVTSSIVITLLPLILILFHIGEL